MDLKFGKKAPKFDKRTLKFAEIVVPTALPPIPDKYDIDDSVGLNVAGNMFGNDSWGDCVIAARANQQLRFELYRHNKIIPVSTDDVLKEYWTEEDASGVKTCWLSKTFGKHPDEGLAMIDSLKRWRKLGWVLNGNNYTIFAFASLDFKNKVEVKQATYLLQGIQVGIQLPQSAINQFNNGESWYVSNENSQIIGGHAIYIVGYDEGGPVCLTWGKKQKITWPFWEKYVDEAYATVDNKNLWIPDDPINVELLNHYLNTITS